MTLRRPSHAWPWLAGLLAGLSLLVWCLPEAWQAMLDWRANSVLTQAWRVWTAALVHLSPLHLLANLAGAAALAWLGWQARLGPRAALAWLLAWPLTQAGLLLQPDLLRFAGLSGVLHAGVAICAVHLLVQQGHERRIGALLALGLLAKLVWDQPLGPALQTRAGWDIAIAPFSHLSGAVAGGLCAWVAQAWRPPIRRPRRAPPTG